MEDKFKNVNVYIERQVDDLTNLYSIVQRTKYPVVLLFRNLKLDITHCKVSEKL